MKLLKQKNPPVKEEVVRVEADINNGLTDEQVLDRILKGYSNIAVESPSKTIPQIILSNVFTYFNLIFFILAIAVIAVGSYNDLLFLPVVFANIFIGTFQEINAKLTLDKLNLIKSPTAAVIREGEQRETTVDNLVVDDIVVFTSGMQICADATVISGDVTVNESLVTGESDEIHKYEGDQLLSGSFIVAGHCYARLEKVGEDSFISQLTLDAKRSKKRKPVGMMKSLTSLIKIIGILIIPVGIFMYINQTQSLGLSVTDGVVKTTAALIGMIPEGLYLLTSVALAVSVIRLAKKKTLVHELSCIETLARVDVLCVDKTGTITENEMNVTALVPLYGTESDAEAILNDFTGNIDDANNTMAALKKRFMQKTFRKAEIIIPFSSSVKYSAESFGGGEGYIIGAPEFVLRGAYQKYKDKIEDLASNGSRVLILCSTSEPLTGGELQIAVSPIALIALSNRIRPEAKDTFKYFAKQGVSVKVISGDNPITVARSAEDAGIPNAENYVDATTLDTPTKITEAAKECTVFGRVTPEQKRQLIRAMKKGGHTVAMTGDGVNDVLALKEADCSIAMASGSEVAGQVSQLVLMDSNFASMPSVVAEGRRVINNIERAAALFLVKNIFSFIMSIVSILAVFTYPLEPSQLSLINAVTIGVPSFFLALEPNVNIVKGKFLWNVIYKALPAGLTNFTLILGAVLFSYGFKIPNAQVSTISAILMGVVGLIMLFRVCYPFNLRRVLLFSVMCIGFALGLALFGTLLFSMTALNFGEVLVLVTLSLLAYPCMRFFTLGLDNIKKIVLKITKKLKPSEDEE